MSWATYVQRLEEGKGKCNYAAIYGKEPVCLWAESSDKSKFPITADEVDNAVKVIRNKDPVVYGNGVSCAKRNFACLVLDDDILICQGKGDNKDVSLVFVLTVQTCIVAVNDQPDVKASNVRDAVEVIAQHLKSSGF